MRGFPLAPYCPLFWLFLVGVELNWIFPLFAALPACLVLVILVGFVYELRFCLHMRP